MPQQDLRLLDFQPGDSFTEAVFAAVDIALRKTKNRAPYLLLKLRDCTGERNAKFWNAPAGILEQLNDAKLVKVGGYVEEKDGFRGDFSLQSIEAFPEPDDLTPFLAPRAADYPAHKDRFSNIVRSVKHPFLLALLKEMFRGDGEFWSRFCEAPAAKSMHHAHRGGLLEHSGEVSVLCDRVAATLRHLDRDLLVTAALLHDIGKLEEMDGGLSAGSYTPAGQLVGHVVLGTCTVAAVAEKIEGFPSKLKHELMHLILSHHGEPEYGAARRPMCAEALVLSLCDLMSAKVAQCHEKAAGTEDFAALGSPWHGMPMTTKGSLYVGLMRELMNGEAE